jgi:ribosome-binding factor A
MDSIRQQKISQLIQKDLAEIFQLNDGVFFPGQMVTVTRVKVSPDLGIAKVALSLFPAKEDLEFKKLVAEYKGSIRYELGKRAKNQLRVIPDLLFFLDDSLDRMEEIEQALKQ